MAIKSHDSLGFVTVTKHGETVLEETRWEYADMESNTDFIRWLIRRAHSENLSNAGALAKGASLKDRVLAVLKKRDSLKRLEVATESGPRLSVDEAETRNFIAAWFLARKVAASKISEIVKNYSEAVKFAAMLTQIDEATIDATWQRAIARRVEDLAALAELPAA